MSIKGIKFRKNHPNSEYSRTYYIRESNVICPICENNEFDLMISKTRDKRKFYSSHSVHFSCDNCGHTVGMFFSGSGIRLTEVINLAKENYKTWKCNLNRKKIELGV